MRIFAAILGFLLLLAAVGFRPGPMRPSASTGSFHYYLVSLPSGGYMEVPEWTVKTVMWFPSLLTASLGVGAIAVAGRRR